jgi:hypothetical protein
MANTTNFGNFPYDVPRIERKGLAYRENAAPGNAEHLNVPPEDPSRRAKGDLGNQTIPNFTPRHSVESPGMPFKIKGS